MKNIICLDIENTIIDDLQTCNFIEENCEKIKRLIDSKRNELFALVFNTWGWATADEIDMNIINRILIKLGFDPSNMGCECRIFTKEFSVDAAIKAGWLNKDDKARALFPGMMLEFGISKISCFYEFMRSVPKLWLSLAGATAKNPIIVTMVDDLVDKAEIQCYHDNKLFAAIVNPTELA